MTHEEFLRNIMLAQARLVGEVYAAAFIADTILQHHTDADAAIAEAQEKLTHLMASIDSFDRAEAGRGEKPVRSWWRPERRSA